MAETTKYLILGSGKFGARAARLLTSQGESHSVSCVDLAADRLSGLPQSVIKIPGEALSVLNRELCSENPPDWIIPAVGLHVAYEWIRAGLGEARAQAASLPGDFTARLPNPMDGPRGAVFCSIADFYCPENCPEPSDHCFFTKKARPYDLHEFLKHNGPDGWVSAVIQSRQLLPGVGGFRPEDLAGAKDIVAQNPGRSVMLATACRCHGVIHGIRLTSG